jgi:hypothetical protein
MVITPHLHAADEPAPGRGELGESRLGGGFVCRGVVRVQILRHLLPVSAGGVAEGVADQVQHTTWTGAWGHTLVIDSGSPLSPSQTMMHASTTPRFLISVSTCS